MTVNPQQPCARESILDLRKARPGCAKPCSGMGPHDLVFHLKMGGLGEIN
jgi:hypothetical protein